MIGATVDSNAAAMAKCVNKRSPDEKVGVFAKKNGKYEMVEYIEIGPELAAMTDPDGRLSYRDGNIVFFTLRTDFLLDLVTSPTKMAELTREFHVQKKKVPQWDPEEGKAVKPEDNNGIKFEIFINSFLLFVPDGAFRLLPVDRNQEFAPIKNAEG